MPLFRDDPALLCAFRNGDRGALEAVYRHYVRAIELHLKVLAHRSGIRAFQEASIVQDLLQDVFVRAFMPNARRAFDEARDFLPYLKAMARNCFIDALRKYRGEACLREEEEPSSSVADNRANDVYDPEVLAALERYLRELNPLVRAVYDQRFVLGRTQEASSAALGLSRRSLRTLEQRLRRGLRKSLLVAGLLHLDGPRRMELTLLDAPWPDFPPSEPGSFPAGDPGGNMV
ncbi:MAG TPA: sigma-70 family RNA polymerase sigma factor [Polyangiaceae bacterium]|jgi:RNA polymerase sigma factor (sigma-70 family)|nr:sigma-70 family RNA polymerase sigma factor [Polyangiaceae bacterium]